MTFDARGFTPVVTLCFLTVLSLVTVVLTEASARDGEPGGFESSDFEVITPKPGFGDDRNSYAWSVRRFKGDLYVGTATHARGSGLEVLRAVVPQ